MAIERSPGNAQGLTDVGDSVALVLVEGLCDGDLLRCVEGGRPGCPPNLPLALAAARPARVRSRMRSRSNSARAPKTWKISLPPLVEVSICSVSEVKATPR